MIKKVFETKEKTASALAGEIFRRIIDTEGPVNIALSGGSTPALLFSKLAGEYGRRIDWTKVRIFWVDERMVPPDDSQSNYRMTAETLLNFIDIPPANVFPLRGGDDPDLEAGRYSELIARTVAGKGGIPSFDIILLGIGDDGHTASIFPDRMDLLESGRICEKAVHPQSGQNRITLTGPVINKGKSVFFFVCGRSKSDIVRRVLERTPELPSSFINPEEGELYFYLDEDAAGH